MGDEPHKKLTGFQIFSLVWIALTGLAGLLAEYVPVGTPVAREFMDHVASVAFFSALALLVVFLIKEVGLLTIALLAVVAAISLYLLSLDPSISKYRLVGVFAALYVLRYRKHLQRFDRELPRMVLALAGYLYGLAARGLSSARDAFKEGISAARRK